MVDDVYSNSFTEVYCILQNTEMELVNKIPLKFVNFLKDNMNSSYIPNIKTDVPIDKQNLLKETESILSLIYRSYWATDEEKKEFAINDKKNFIDNEILKKENYKGKDIYNLFKNKENLNDIVLPDSLVTIKKENFIKKFFNKILKILKK
jgi:hypothetical protein